MNGKNRIQIIKLQELASRIFTSKGDGRGQLDEGDIVLNLFWISIRMHSEIGGNNRDLRGLDNVLIVGAESDFERGTAVGTMDGCQNPISRDECSTAEPCIINV